MAKLAQRKYSCLVAFVLALLFNATGQQRSTSAAEKSGQPSAPASAEAGAEGAHGIVYFSFDNGVTWVNKSNGLPATVNVSLGAIAVSDNALALATDDGVYLFNTGASAWQSIYTDNDARRSGLSSLVFYKGLLYAGTKGGGVFTRLDNGKTWQRLNSGLHNLNIRRLAVISGILYGCTNGGLYKYDDQQRTWQLVYGKGMQVNAVIETGQRIYIATNQGAFETTKGNHNWKNILADHSLHNIAADGHTIYALTYNELRLSRDNGVTWHSDQNGLPSGLYTFHVRLAGPHILAAQWDGVYRKERGKSLWILSSNGLPEKFAVTNMQIYNGAVVISGSRSAPRQ